MVSLINASQEFYEVLNAFPILKERLEQLKFNIHDLKEGQSIREYFSNKSYTLEEIELFVRRLNTEVNYYLKKGELCSSIEKSPLKQVILEEEEEEEEIFEDEEILEEEE